MKLKYTIQQYIQSPLTEEEIECFRKRESVKFYLSWSATLLTCFWFLWVAPAALKIFTIFAIIPVMIVSLCFVEGVVKLKGVSFSDAHVVVAGYCKKSALYDHHENLKIPEVVLLKTNIKKLGRAYIKLDRDVIQHLYLEALSEKATDLVGR